MTMDRKIKRIDNALLIVIAFSLIMLAIMIAAGVIHKRNTHTWNIMYEDDYIKVERCECGEERFFTK